MTKYCVMYNPLSNNSTGLEAAKGFESVVDGGEFEYKSVLEIKDYAEYLESVPSEVTMVLAGGDGTINKFVNLLGDYEVKRDILYFPAGTGNDFMHDISEDGSLKYVKLNPYIVNLPRVEIDGKISKFINGIGYGIDG